MVKIWLCYQLKATIKFTSWKRFCLDIFLGDPNIFHEWTKTGNGVLQQILKKLWNVFVSRQNWKNYIIWGRNLRIIGWISALKWGNSAAMRWCPPVLSWVINHGNKLDISTINIHKPCIVDLKLCASTSRDSEVGLSLSSTRFSGTTWTSRLHHPMSSGFLWKSINYHLVMTNSSPWKIPIVELGKPSISIRALA